MAEQPADYDHKRMQEKWNSYWKKMNLLGKARKKNAGKPKFFYLDGPPYANAPPHLGHARTRILRECVLKYRQMRGHDVWLQPGFDCHGLPVEVMVEKEIGSHSKADIEGYGIEEFNSACRQHATKFLKLWAEFYERFGTTALMNLDRPYMTMDNDYIESSWHFFKAVREKDLLYKGKATVAWCPRCETALSGYEVTQEYRDVNDISIYIKFAIKGRPGEYFLVWTTTPWTLPGNVAISLNPRYTYAKVKAGNDYLWMAKDLVGRVMAALGITVYEIAEERSGEELDGLEYEHPLDLEMHRRIKHRVILADFVTLDEGTGCVHTAPGHGPEDYSAGMKYGLAMLCPVDSRGILTEEAGKYAGKFVFDANPDVVADLKAGRALAKSEEITHRYAHCWRCKSKLIYITSDQWFVRIEPVKQLMLSENAKVRWVPEWAGSRRFHDWLTNARDWCLSHQRYWGIPLPIWECGKCGKHEVFASSEEIRQRGGDVPADLHRPYIDDVVLRCACGSEMRRIPDIADVWFDSGAAPYASLGYPGERQRFEALFPIDFITEAVDQTRGWFYYLLLESAILFGRTPFLSVLMNGLILDMHGEKMSKSKGNIVDPFEAIDRYGSDALRWYLLWSVTPWEDTRFSFDDFGIIHGAVCTLWNAYRFAAKYFELDGFRPGAKPALEAEDRWILSRLEGLTKATTESYEGLNPNSAARLLRDFVVDDLSRSYIKYIRNRLKDFQSPAAGEKKGRNKAGAYWALHRVMERLAIISAPITPFIAEEVYQGLGGKRDSVHLEDWPAFAEQDAKLEQQMSAAARIIEVAANVRNSLGINLRQPLAELWASSGDPGIEEAVAALPGLIADQANVKRAAFGKPQQGDFASAEAGGITVFLPRAAGSDLLREGAVREVVRRIQQMRKEARLVESDRIEVGITAGREFLERLDAGQIARLTNATEVGFVAVTGTKKEWKIGNAAVTISVRKLP